VPSLSLISPKAMKAQLVPDGVNPVHSAIHGAEPSTLLSSKIEVKSLIFMVPSLRENPNRKQTL
jgi:hypothetical protein